MAESGKFAKLPGFRDFPPEDFALRSHILDSWRRVSRRYGFVEYDAPPLEGLDLYTAKSGDEIAGQLYEFTDKGGRRVALRPEMTPSLARILAERSRSIPKPVRWFSIPQLFRYERQQRGRLREHFQWNVDLVGEGGIEADAEVLAIAIDGLRDLGLNVDELRARVSDRALLSGILRSLGVPDLQLDAAFAVVDRMEKAPRERTVALLEEKDKIGLTKDQAESVLDVFNDSDIDRVERRFGDDQTVAARLSEIRRYLGLLDDLGVGDFVEFDLKIVRGLAYYTGIVFEVFDRAGDFRAVCGGGRYDRLLEHVGGESLPAVGFGMGDVVLGEILKDKGRAPEYRPWVDYFIVAIGEGHSGLVRRVAHAQRAQGKSVVYSLAAQSVRKQFSSAASMGAESVIVLGPDELARGIAVLRDMASGEEREVGIEQLTALSISDL